MQGCQFFKVFDEHQLEYVLLAYGESDDVYMIGKIASFQIQNLLIAYKERFDKDNFIKNLLLDNLLLVDIYNRAKKLHIEADVRRAVYIIETNREKDGNELERVRSLFGGKSKDFVTAVDEKNIIVVKELAENEGYDELAKTAEVIWNLFSSDPNGQEHIAYGTIVNVAARLAEAGDVLENWLAGNLNNGFAGVGFDACVGVNSRGCVLCQRMKSPFPVGWVTSICCLIE